MSSEYEVFGAGYHCSTNEIQSELQVYSSTWNQYAKSSYPQLRNLSVHSGIMFISMRRKYLRSHLRALSDA